MGFAKSAQLLNKQRPVNIKHSPVFIELAQLFREIGTAVLRSQGNDH
jgi:hypothetical protein